MHYLIHKYICGVAPATIVLVTNTDIILPPGPSLSSEDILSAVSTLLEFLKSTCCVIPAEFVVRSDRLGWVVVFMSMVSYYIYFF